MNSFLKFYPYEICWVLIFCWESAKRFALCRVKSAPQSSHFPKPPVFCQIPRQTWLVVAERFLNYDPCNFWKEFIITTGGPPESTIVLWVALSGIWLVANIKIGLFGSKYLRPQKIPLWYFEYLFVRLEILVGKSGKHKNQPTPRIALSVGS